MLSVWGSWGLSSGGASAAAFPPVAGAGGEVLAVLGGEPEEGVILNLGPDPAGLLGLQGAAGSLVADERQIADELGIANELGIADELQVTDDLQVADELGIADELPVTNELQVTDELQVAAGSPATEGLQVAEISPGSEGAAGIELAQTPPVDRVRDRVDPQLLRDAQDPADRLDPVPDRFESPREQPDSLPPPEQLLQPANPSPGLGDRLGEPETIQVDRYEVLGSTVFSAETLATATQPFTGPSVSFAQLLQARSAVTQLYEDGGYIYSLAFLPEQTLEGGVVTLQVIETSLTEVTVEGLGRLRDSYVTSRVRKATGTPLQRDRLLQGLRLLQLDPLLQTLSAELSMGLRPGESTLHLTVTQAPTFTMGAGFDNGRVPSVGSFRRQFSVREGNLLGFGDGLGVRYNNTQASNSVDVDYTLPINARNGTLSLLYSRSGSQVIEEPFDILEIRSAAQTWDLSLRQPLYQTPTQEFAVGLGLNHRSTTTSLEVEGTRFDFPLSQGAGDDGRTRLSVVNITQDWTRRGASQVLGFRSQFNLGTDWLGATQNSDQPDSSFFSWQGQGQWVRQFAPDTLLLVKGNLQLADRPLLSLEQFSNGGFGSVRGYRQDQLLTDNGFFGSIEARIPIFRIRQINSVAQVTPFFDYGVGWNSGEGDNPSQRRLASVGVGLRWGFADRVTARLDWGLPLINNDDNDYGSLQEHGFLFSIETDLSPF
ncbi:ShlB/FhaC/HecB family hemolysin secretion/activation protein [Prochlorothrix hollandica]|uniref:ShlB/FhaC/HecB family hemolysin secretion/activation protein n=1 Tax=Prochlorothrix hollandica TaxID=1223 RepID=UPI0003478020|nr:ShlB/FhaC/HecB family hemolysin secretion/activation protein [Prochlorothrix hollandica]